jgi:L-threonylcarbamoyladenylate synthase
LETKIFSMDDPHLKPLNEAAEILQNGGLVAFPTETVYGLGAVYNNESALRKVFAVKGRPADNPLIVHIWQLTQLAELTTEIGPKAERLIEEFWPGPLTLIFPKKKNVSAIVSAGLDTVAVRMPSHPVAHELLRITGIPVAAPSANLSGRPSPTLGDHVREDLAGKIDAIIDAGPCAKGIESTVLSLIRQVPVILRPGSVTREMMETVLGETVEISNGRAQDRPQAPGMKYRHYAPQAPVLLIEGENRKVVAEINRLLALSPSQKAIVLGSTENIGLYRNEWVLDLGPQANPEIIANRLYQLLRFCDQLPVEMIYIEGVESTGVGLAIANRIQKAAGGNVIHVS